MRPGLSLLCVLLTSTPDANPTEVAERYWQERRVFSVSPRSVNRARLGLTRKKKTFHASGAGRQKAEWRPARHTPHPVWRPWPPSAWSSLTKPAATRSWPGARARPLRAINHMTTSPITMATMCTLVGPLDRAAAHPDDAKAVDGLAFAPRL